MSPFTAPVDLVVRGAQVMESDGSFSLAQVHVAGARIVAVDRRPGTLDGAPGGATVVEAAGRWLIPGIVDCHTHLGWTTFLPDDEPGDLAPGLAATLAAGVTSARDAGGAGSGLRDEVAGGALPGPRLAVAIEMITAQTGGVGALRERVRALVDDGADWIKVMATGGVMAPAGTELESAFSAAEITAVVDQARALGVPVMVHAWGGDAVTHAIAAGAASIEHGIFLTPEQAAAGAAAGTALVPTLAIYAEVARMAERGALPGADLDRVRRIVAAHPRAVRTAHEAGMKVALGSDFGTSDQHGRNLVEIDHLARAGLGARGALLAATRTGAELLGTGTGLLEVGEVFDAVLLAEDPSEAGVFLRRETVVGVYQDGRAVR